jgi:hypothetical protein
MLLLAACKTLDKKNCTEFELKFQTCKVFHKVHSFFSTSDRRADKCQNNSDSKLHTHGGRKKKKKKRIEKFIYSGGGEKFTQTEILDGNPNQIQFMQPKKKKKEEEEEEEEEESHQSKRVLHGL